MMYKLEEGELTLSLLDGRLGFTFDGTSYAQLGYRIGSNGVHSPSEQTAPIMKVQRPLFPKRYDAVAFPVLAPGNSALSSMADISDFHCLYGHSNEIILRETAKQLGIELQREQMPCTGCSMAKGYRKPSGSRINTRADKKLGRLFVDLSAPKPIFSLAGKSYVMIMMISLGSRGCTCLSESLMQQKPSTMFWLLFALMVFPLRYR